MEYEKLTQKIQHLNIKNGNDCLNKDELLFRVNLIDTGKNRFAIILSVSHILADGFTYYTIYKMLSDDQPAFVLDAERQQDFENRRIKIMGGLEDYDWLLSFWATLGIFKTLLFHKKPNVFIQDFDLDQIEIQKKQEKKSLKKVQFISTNDLLTSWLFTLVKCDVGMMAVNFRNRINDIT